MVDKDFNLKGLITVKDIQKKLEFPNATKDEHGRLRWARRLARPAIIWNARRKWRAPGVDVLAIDTAHGHSTRVMEAIRAVKHALPDMELVAGNVGTFEGAQRFNRAGNGWSEGRNWAGLDLHDAHCDRRGSAADYGDSGGRARDARGQACR